MTKIDALILGAGPAGLAAAIRLSQLGRSVRLIDRPVREMPRIGETLSPAVKPALSALGVWNTFLSTRPIPCPGITSRWGATESEETDFGLRCGWHVERAKFDEMLIGVAAKLAVPPTIAARIMEMKKMRDGWRVNYKTGNVSRQIACRFVIDATGRSAILAKRLGIERITSDPMICILKFGRGPKSDPRIIIESVPNGWWYASQIPGGRILIAFMTDPSLFNRAAKGLDDRWRRALKNAPLMASWSQGLKLDPTPQICSANTCRQSQLFGTSWILVGDAAVAGDPLSGTGTAHAFLSGLEAADAVQQNLDGDRDTLQEYSDRLLLRYEEGLEQRCGWYSQERRWKDKPFWRRRIPARSQQVEERLVFRS